MTWCETCSRDVAEHSVDVDGTCPTCDSGVKLSSGSKHPKVPWHFWLLVTAAGLYLAWRGIQAIIWLVLH